MEERLDDAIHVLRTHAEGSLPPGMSPVVAGSMLSAAAAVAASGASVQGVNYSPSVGEQCTVCCSTHGSNGEPVNSNCLV